jgi:hypothetical protein
VDPGVGACLAELRAAHRDIAAAAPALGALLDAISSMRVIELALIQIFNACFAAFSLSQWRAHFLWSPTRPCVGSSLDRMIGGVHFLYLPLIQTTRWPLSTMDLWMPCSAASNQQVIRPHVHVPR